MGWCGLRLLTGLCCAVVLIASPVFVLFDYLWNEMNANYGSFSSTLQAVWNGVLYPMFQSDCLLFGVSVPVVVIQATSDRILDVLEEGRGDLSSVLAELRTQSLTNVGKKRRPSSRSMEDFLTSINSNIANASSPMPRVDVTGLTAPDGSPILPSTPPPSSGRNSLSSTSPRSSWSFTGQLANRLSLGSLGGTSASSSATASTSTATTAATPATAAFDVLNAPMPAPSRPQPTPGVLDFDPFAGNDIRGLEQKTEGEQEQSDDPFACLM